MGGNLAPIWSSVEKAASDELNSLAETGHFVPPKVTITQHDIDQVLPKDTQDTISATLANLTGVKGVQDRIVIVGLAVAVALALAVVLVRRRSGGAHAGR